MISQIAAVAADYDGVVVDFENLKVASKENFTVFLKELKAMLNSDAGYMAVAVQPARTVEYYDGYDFKSIGNAADLVILMAHDYNAKKLSYDEMMSGFTTTPLSPINDVYYALSRITDSETGVTDVSKVCLQLSFASAQWKVRNGAIINEIPYTPAYSAIYNRIADCAQVNYSEKYENPYISFFNHDDRTNNIVWYENKRSVNAKLRLASLFGVKGLSVWRLGLIPEDALDLFQ
jgi:spore germination protein YaaH